MGVNLPFLPQSSKRYHVYDTFLPRLPYFSISAPGLDPGYPSGNFIGIQLSVKQKVHLNFFPSRTFYYKQNFMVQIFILDQSVILNMARLLLLLQKEPLGQAPPLSFSFSHINRAYILSGPLHIDQRRSVNRQKQSLGPSTQSGKWHQGKIMTAGYLTYYLKANIVYRNRKFNSYLLFALQLAELKIQNLLSPTDELVITCPPILCESTVKSLPESGS